MSKFENLRLDNQLCFALYAATNAITRAYRTGLNEVGLTYPQYLVMIVLWEGEGVTVKNIAERLQLDSPTLTPILKRLEANGFITRERNKQDERVVNVSLTPAGKKIQSKVAKIQNGIACQSGLNETEFRELRAALHELVDSFNPETPQLKCSA